MLIRSPPLHYHVPKNALLQHGLHSSTRIPPRLKSYRTLSLGAQATSSSSTIVQWLVQEGMTPQLLSLLDVLKRALGSGEQSGNPGPASQPESNAGPRAASNLSPFPLPLGSPAATANGSGNGIGGRSDGTAATSMASSAGPSSRPLRRNPIPTEFAPLPDFAPAPYVEFTLPNGLRVFVMEDHEVPLARGTLLMRGGQRGSPENLLGVASFASSLQRLGGSTAHPQPSFDFELEGLAASIEGGAGNDATSLGFSCLSEDVARVLGLMSELVQSPALPAEKLEFIRAQAINGFAHRNDNPTALPRRESLRLLYGPDSVYARQPTAADLRAIGLADIQAYLSKWQRPDAAVLGIVGDVDPKAMRTLVEASFGGWSPAQGQPWRPLPLPTSPVPTAAAPQGADRRDIYLIDRPGLQNSIVVLSDIGVKLQDPALYPLEVLNKALNGFGGLLFEEVRGKRGLAYSVSGAFEAGVDHPGTLFVGGDTAKPAEFIRAVESVLSSLVAEPLPDKTVAEAKQRSENEFVFNFASTSNQLGRVVSYDLLGIDQRFLYKFRQGIDDVDALDVYNATVQHLRVGKSLIVLVGDASVVLEDLRALAAERGCAVHAVDVESDPPTYRTLVERK